MPEQPFQVSCCPQVAEQTLAAFGVNTCQGLLDKKGLLAALYSPVSMDFFLASGLALGQTRHSEPVAEGEVGRKGISCERTFGPISKPSELEAKVGILRLNSVQHLLCKYF